MHYFVGRNLSFPSQNCFKLPRLLPVLSHHGCHRKSCVHLERAVGISAPFTSERHHFHCHFKTSIFCYLSALPPCYHAYAYCVGRCRRVVVQRWGKRGSQHHFSRSAMCVWGAKERVGIQLEWKERRRLREGIRKGWGKMVEGRLWGCCCRKHGSLLNMQDDDDGQRACVTVLQKVMLFWVSINMFQRKSAPSHDSEDPRKEFIHYIQLTVALLSSPAPNFSGFKVRCRWMEG